MTHVQKSNLRGALMSLTAFMLFASHDVIIKTLGKSYATFQILFFSVLLSFPLIVLMLMRDKSPGTLIPVHPWWTVLRTGSVVITATSGLYAFTHLPLAQVYAIVFATPLLVTVLAIPILGEKVGGHRWAAVVLGLAGVLIVVRPGHEALSGGHVAAMTAAVFSALGAVIIRKIGPDERSAVMLVYPLMANFVLMAIALPFVYRPMPVEHLGLVGVMAVLAFIGGLLVIFAYKAGDAAVVAPMQYSQMIWAALFGSLLFGETGDLMTWVGAGVIITSGLYILARESLFGASALRPVLGARSRVETGSPARVSSVDL